MREAVEQADNRKIYEECAPELFRRLRRGFSYAVAGGARRFLRLNSRFEQEEVVQETFCRFLTQRKRGTFDDGRSAAPYVYRIGFYTALRYAGRLTREVPMDDVEFFDGEAGSGFVDASEELLRKERSAQVRSVITKLNQREQDVFSLTYESGLSQAKVAQRLGLSRDQVYRILVSIRTQTLEHLTHLGWLDES